jgi:general secretion pathway protein G
MTRPGIQRGFTLIELVVVVAIMGVLVVSARPMLELSYRRSQEFALREALRGLRTAIDEYKRLADAGAIAKPADSSGYPPNLEVLADGVTDARTPDGSRRHYLLRRIPRDPFADPALSAARTWALRSYQSPPDAPEPGRDVFDVASRSSALALDGTRLAEW